MKNKKRFLLGATLFLIGQTFPLWIPVIVASNIPGGWKTALSGLFAFGIPNIFMIATVMILGKTGFDTLKKTIFGWFSTNIAPAQSVSPFRYTIGLLLFIPPLLLGLMTPYFIDMIPEIETHFKTVAVIGDIMIIVSFFILGGDFWDKLRALFIYSAKVNFPKQAKH